MREEQQEQDQMFRWSCEEGFSEMIPARKSAEELVRTLRTIGQTVATAESCTGGLTASHIVSVPGASEVFQTGFITYCDEAKIRILQVDPDTLRTETAVSARTAAQMAVGCARVGQADLALSVTGLAGPGGETPGRPVGLVYIGCFYRGRTLVQEYHLRGDRDEIRSQAAAFALQLGYYCLRAR